MCVWPGNVLEEGCRSSFSARKSSVTAAKNNCGVVRVAVILTSSDVSEEHRSEVREERALEVERAGSGRPPRGSACTRPGHHHARGRAAREGGGGRG
eukprot:3331338-Rhodomonas_salina.2